MIILDKSVTKKGDENHESTKKHRRFQRMKSKKFANFHSKSGKLTVQLENEYYKNWKNAQTQKI